MADTKISALTEATSAASNDLIALVDVDDTTMASSGTTKRITKANLTSGLASDTHTHDDATTSASGHMSAADKTKLDGVATGAEVNVNADWNSSSGDSQILNKPSTFTPESHTHSISDVTSLQTSLDSKQATITGAATTIDTEDLTSSRALESNGSGKVSASSVTSTELGYVSGVSSAIQTQIDGKAASSHAHGLNDLSDVSTAGAANGKIIKHNGTSWVIADDSGGSGSGSSDFVGLSDTPSSLNANKWLKVNSSGDAIEETDAPATYSAGDGLSLSGTTFSADTGTGSTQVAAGDHNHDSDYAATSHNHSNFTGDSGSGGSAGMVPAPAAGDAAADKYLDADGTWSSPPASNITTQPLFEHSNTISADYTIGTGNNAVSAGDPTIGSGYTVTVPSGSSWVVV